MGFKDLFKTRKKTVKPEAGLEVPPAPGSKEELPTFPSPDEIPEFKKQELKAPELPKREGPSPLEREEQRAMRLGREAVEEREELKLKKPIFVYLDLYKEAIGEVNIIQNTLKEGTDSLARVSEFKEEEDKQFTKWESHIKDVQRKLIFADKTLFAAQKGR
ncbi:hypothetical protein KY332_04395 [Candidatus Woesearchaeota archaeon]|nr:hypothetical protein [Candidatus Woesearchaeota archaeon]